jgi:hypothetical protein
MIGRCTASIRIQRRERSANRHNPDMSDEPRIDGWLPPRPPEGPAPPAPAPLPADRRSPSAPRPVRGPRVDPLAVTALASALLGLVLLLVSLLGWRLGGRARRRIAVHGGTGGDTVARAGLVLGLAGIALAVVAMVVWTVLVLSGYSIAELQDSLEHELERRRRGS